MYTRLTLAEDVEAMSLVTNQRALVNRAIQIALNRVFESHDFPYYIQDKGVIETTDDVTAGTVAVTNGSKTITGTDTAFTVGMVGRKFRFEGDNAYYRIGAFTSTTEITLEENYAGDTDTSGTYVIYKDEYRLEADVDKYKMLRQAENNTILFSLHPSRFDESQPMPQSLGDPFYEIMEGTLLDTYSTGTVSASASSTTLTGSSTAWTGVEGLGRMSKITVGATASRTVLTVKSVNSDTEITTYETIDTAISASTTYFATLNNLRVQVGNIPDDTKLIYYRYFRQPELLANNYDIPDMPHNFHWVLLYGALSVIYMLKGDINKSQVQAEKRFVDGLNLMKVKLGSFTPDRTYRRKSTDRVRTTRGLTDGLETSAFDRRFSS